MTFGSMEGRYVSEDVLGTTGRGNATEVGTYIDAYFDSEFSGNVIDLCPVGALTNKAAAFKVRPWDLQIYESIDVMEATSASIVLDTRFNELIRIKPRLNEDVNEEWISDKSRFCVDAVKRQRLDMPLLKNAQGELDPVTWPDAPSGRSGGGSAPAGDRGREGAPSEGGGGATAATGRRSATARSRGGSTATA